MYCILWTVHIEFARNGDAPDVSQLLLGLISVESWVEKRQLVGKMSVLQIQVLGSDLVEREMEEREFVGKMSVLQV